MAKSQRIYYNNAKTTLSAPLNPGDTVMSVASVAKFSPAPTAGQYFLITVDTGSSIEIIEVHGISGSTFTGCVRAREGTTEGSFLTGTRVENRYTAGTLGSFARYQDVMAPLASLDLLDSPANSDATSYIVATYDEGGNPIITVAKGSSWKFLNYSALVAAGALASAGTTTSIPLVGSSSLPSTANSVLIQFTGGTNIGKARIITNTVGNTISWITPLASAPQIGDTYEVYQSSSSAIASLLTAANNSLTYAILFGE